MLIVPWPDSNFVTFVLLFFLAWLTTRILRVGRRESYLPPGPPTIPILGNLHVFPTSSPYIKFAEWGQQYGDIYSLKISSGNAIVINSMEVATELVDKRSATTADRPKLHMVDKVTGGLNLALCRYSDTWLILRKAAHTILTPKAVEKHLPIQVFFTPARFQAKVDRLPLHKQLAEATQVLHDLLTNPDDFSKHIGRYSNSVIMSALFGKRCPRYETYESTEFFEIMELWNLCISPTAVPPVDLLPFLDYVPEKWAWWKRLAAKTRQKQRALYFGLVDECEQRIKRGEENGSYIEEILTRQEELGLDREMVGYLGGVLIEGGSETTSFLKYLVIALVSFPDVQRKAQAEIDRVIGHERMPSLADIRNLPYMQALIKEIHRFRPLLPLVPHATMADEEYRGSVIPKGTTIFVNTHAILRNSRDFDDPDMFNPDRYLVNEYGIKEGADPSPFRNNISFGYGRRTCPGIHLAEYSLNLNAMNLIWAFDFRTGKDSMGNEIPVSLDHYEKNGLLPTPLPFKCQIEPRNQNVVKIVEREFKEATETFVKFERDPVPADKRWVNELRNSF